MPGYNLAQLRRLGVGIVLVVSSWARSKSGLWGSLVCGALPLLWVVNAIFQNAGE